jgi:hypothetical protein
MRRSVTLIVLVLCGVAAILAVQHRTQAKLRQENEALRGEIARLQAENSNLSNRTARVRTMPALRLPAPSVQLSSPPAESSAPSETTNLFARFPGLQARAPHRLTAGQVDSYLQANGRSAASLLAAARTTRDPAFLAEAMQKFPNQPQVALEAALRKDASAEDRRQWLDALKQLDPENALPDYLSALSHLKAGQTDQAVQDLLAAASKPSFDDYSARSLQDTEQAYIAAGYSPAEAKAIRPLQEAIIAGSGSTEDAEAFAPLQSLRTLEQIKALAVNLHDLAQSYQKAGDPASAQAARQLAVGLGQRYSHSLADGLSQLVGTAVEAIGLRDRDPQSPYGSDGQTVEERTRQLKDQRMAVRRLYQQAGPLLGLMSSQDWSSYTDRSRIFGEAAALQWVVGKYGSE